ncbi:MAG: hypothetical protein ACRD99_01500, partial [Nitrososphaera sp.]
MNSDDPDIELIQARKLREMREKAAAMERAKAAAKAHQQKKQPSSREVVNGFLHDRGDEVLRLAYEQYPS